MSSPETPDRPSRPSRRLVLRSAGGALVTLGVLAVGGCGDGGFRPLYGPTAVGGAPLSARMAEVEIAQIGGRVGQQVRNELIFATTGGGSPAPPAYTLEIVITESMSASLVRSTGEASSQIYSLEANFRLVRKSDKAVLLTGASFGRASFERYQPIFGNVRAREDAENRAAKTVADDLKVRLSSFLATNT